MNYKNVKKLIAATVSSGMLVGAIALTGDYHALAEEAEKGSVSLAIAGEDETKEEATEDVKEEATEAEAAEESTTEAEKAEDAEKVTLGAEEATEKETIDEEAPVAEADEKSDLGQLETTATGSEGITTTDVSGIVEKTMPSIVAITTKSIVEAQSYYYGPQEQEAEGAGSGVIIAQNDDELLIATNNHVVADTSELTVCFTVDAEDEEQLFVEGVVKGTSPKYDLAVVAVKKSDIDPAVYKQLRIATLGNSDKLKVGEASIVIGNALGSGQTVTTGIISALEREVVTEAGTFTEFQTDAAVNLGCSGGAILNSKGEVVGITSAKATGDYAESMGYGIPISTAIPVLENLINRQTRDVVENHGYMGITVVPVSEEAMQMYNMPAGAFVYEVGEGSSAEEAGIKKGDIITKFDGIDIDSSDTLVSTMSYYSAGETVKVEVQTNIGGSYETKEVDVTLQEGAPETKTDSKADQKDDGNADNQNNEQEAPQQDENEQEQDDQNGQNELAPYQSNGDQYEGQNPWGGQGDYNNGEGDYGQYMNPWQFFFGNGFGGNGGF